MNIQTRLCRIFFLSLLSLSLWPVWLSVHAQETILIPSPPITFQAGQGSEIATSYCLICHSAEYVYTQPLLSRTQWHETVEKMKHQFGCPVPDEQVSTLVDYLVGQNTTRPTSQKNNGSERSPSHLTGIGSAAKGQAVYDRYCTNCHGPQGKGDGPIGQALVPPAANLTIIGKKSDDEILETIRKGRPGTAMPSWKNDLSDKEIHDILAYLRTLGH
ncbi:MAG: c-type cytochrome [Nitrospirales bacterium]|nr:c-type cytochrome [Nitrospira sp.]MDR4502519.1 c-type cytochrome [Nitrospirales bacterium]